MKTDTIINFVSRRKAGRMVLRFPVSVLLLVWLAAELFRNSVDSGFGNMQPNRLYLILFGGAVIGLAAALWFEDRLRGWKPHAAAAAAALLWGAYCHFGMPQMSAAYILDEDWREFLGGAILLETQVFPKFFIYNLLELMMITAGAALLVFIPFLGKNRDAAFGNFFSKIFFHFIIAYAISAFFKIALSFIYASYIAPAFIIADIFCYVLFVPLWVMAHIPDKDAKYGNEPAVNQFTKVIGLHFLIPVVMLCTLILYIYCLHCWNSWITGVAWNLPEYIDAAILVSALAAAGLLAITLISPARLYGDNPQIRNRDGYDEDGNWYPSRLLREKRQCASDERPSANEERPNTNDEREDPLPPSNESSSIAALSRWFGAAILPLLIFMTVTVILHINEHGMTIAGGYLFLINLWFYGIYGYLFLTNARGVKWIPISLGALLVLSSTGPWSVSNVTKRVLVADVARAMDAPQLFFEYGSAREMLYQALGDSPWGEFYKGGYEDIDSPLKYVSDEDRRFEVEHKGRYLLNAYAWKSKSDGKDENVFDSYAAGDFMIKPARKQNTVTIVGYTGNDTVLSIPPKLDGKDVIRIGKDAFAGKGIVSVTIPRGVLTVGDRAFMHNRLAAVTIPSGVTAIGAEAFLANELAGVTIPGSMTAIGERAFAHNELSRVAIPNSVSYIGEQAFAHNRLSGVTIPSRLALIRESAFADNRLTRVSIPNGVTAIGREAFARNRLTSVAFPRSIEVIAANAFAENKQDIAMPKR